MKHLVLVFILLLALPSLAAVAKVQSTAQNFDWQTSSWSSITMPGATTAGNVIFIVVATDKSGANFWVLDSLGNTVNSCQSPAGTNHTVGSSPVFQCFWIKVAAGKAGTGHTFSYQSDTSGNYNYAMAAVELSGITTISDDVNNSYSGSTASATRITTAMTGPEDLVIETAGTFGTPTLGGTGYSAGTVSPGGNVSVILGWLDNATATGATASGSVTQSGTYGMSLLVSTFVITEQAPSVRLRVIEVIQ